MTGRLSFRRGGVLCALAVAATVFGAGAASAGAWTVSAWDPQTTNVPYLGWAGNEIRLEKCFDAPRVTADNEAKFDFGTVRAEFLVEDWSGGSILPQIEDPTVKLYWSRSLDAICAQGDVVSLYPGMSRIELDIIDNAGVLGLPGWGPATPVVKHQFLAGWMTLNHPTLTELSAGSFPATAQGEAARELGDPSGNGEFNAGGGSGYLSLKVTGSMPMNGAWAGLVGASSVTLPNDWVTLAHALATDDNPLDTTPWTTWDTSGDSTGYGGHVTPTPPCSAVPAQFASVPSQPLGPNSYAAKLDNVDDCTGGGPDGPFSRVFGDLSSSNSVGPFDPLWPNDTLLPNGDLSSQDAPMPPARVDFTIAPNSGSSTDTSGVGSLVAADKSKTYSRDFKGPDGVAGNEYAPFYDAYIPATSRPGDASSGIDGGAANNFNGFLVDGKYHFWSVAASLASNDGGATSCLERSRDPQTDSPTAHPWDYYQLPSGDSAVAVYTDQNGEAQVQWVPGTGFYFNSLIANGGAITNADGGCDLQSLYQVPDSLGTASIGATVRYPYKPVDFAAVTSNSVTKSVTSLWSKTLAYFPKGTGAANANSRIVVAHAQNIDGTPFAGEVVCFSANAEAVSWFNGTVAGINLKYTSPGRDPKPGSQGRTCVTTDGNGNAAVEILESNPVAVDVIADFTNEGILRDISVDFGTAGSTGGTPPPASTGSGAPPPKWNTGTTAPSYTSGGIVPPRKVLARIALLRTVSPAHGARYLVLRVNAGTAYVRVQITTVIHGRVHRRTVTILANHTVRIKLGNARLRAVTLR